MTTSGWRLEEQVDLGVLARMMASYRAEDSEPGVDAFVRQSLEDRSCGLEENLGVDVAHIGNSLQLLADRGL